MGGSGKSRDLAERSGAKADRQRPGTAEPYPTETVGSMQNPDGAMVAPNRRSRQRIAGLPVE